MQLNLLVQLDNLKVLNEGVSKLIWDPCRRKWVLLTPEEMVRQLFIAYLTKQLGFSINRIGVEKEIKLEKTTKRFDLIIYNSALKPYVLVECKAPDIKLNEPVIAQVVRYNRVLSAEFLVVINGQECRIFNSTASTWIEQDVFPPLV